MIRLINIPEIPSGDFTQVDPSNLGDKVFLFDDDIKGICVAKFGELIPVGSGLEPTAKTNADLIFDGFQWYLELPGAKAVLSCSVNGKSYNGQLDETYPIARYYCSGFIDDITPQIINIYEI